MGHEWRIWEAQEWLLKLWNEMFEQKQRQRGSMRLAVTVGWTGSDRMERSVYGSFKNAQHGILMSMGSAGRKLVTCLVIPCSPQRAPPLPVKAGRRKKKKTEMSVLCGSLGYLLFMPLEDVQLVI